ncbi:hypothetical protein Tco_0992350 [Tanacetum coccineum]|uniref:Uncharacterized protein n=1 Tax=Tanacetum coccineum TaxID=301880 RepID=A0ABQ5F1U5_9ASTR
MTENLHWLVLLWREQKECASCVRVELKMILAMEKIGFAGPEAQPPPKDDDQSLKKPRESDASASKQHPALTSTGWQITDTRDAVVDSLMHRSDPELEHFEQSSDDILMQDEGHTYDIGPFIKWFCRRTGKKKLYKADLEGPAFNLVKAFHKNKVFLQYQMDECHKLLMNKVSPLIEKQSRSQMRILSVDQCHRSVPTQYSRKDSPSAQDRQDKYFTQ